MAPKKAATASKSKAPSAHGSYKDMIKAAIVALKDRLGSSRQAIRKYVQANNNLGNSSDAAIGKHINQAIAAGVKSGDFEQPKGTSGGVKIARKGAAPATAAAAPKTATKAAAKPKTATKTTTKKPAAAKKAPVTKKGPATKTTTAKKPVATKAVKANTAKQRKSPASKAPKAAPAVEANKPVVLGKTKSGRVTKSSAPPAAKKAAPKKTAAKKAATPKKAAAKAS